MNVVNTACPRNCYSSCSFRVEVDEGKIIGIQPQPINLSTPEGPCLKGLSYVERAISKDRILYPLAKRSGQFVRISWEEAYSMITSKLIDYRDQFGSHSVLFYAASGMSGLLNEVSTNFWRMFGGATTVYGNLCWPAGLEATRLTLGSNKHNVPQDLANARLIVLWGKNPAETNIHQMVFINQAKQAGARILVIDPRMTATAEKADLLLQPKPGTDGLLALSIAKIIIDENLQDAKFIGKHVLGFKRFCQSLVKINLEEAAKTVGIPLSLIKNAAHWIGTLKPMTLIPGYGMQRFSNGGQTTRCLLALSVITGNLARKGACWHYANLQSYVFDAVLEPESYYPDPDKDHPFRRIIPTARLGEKMLEIRNPELKMAWIERGNPVSQNPDSHVIIAAFKKLKFTVVIEQFMTDTARLADLVLPAKNMFEQSDIIGSYWNPYIQLKQKVMEPPGEVKPETSIYHELANRLGFDADEIKANIPEPSDAGIENWLQIHINRIKGITMEQLKKGPVLAPGLEEIAFKDHVFNTPSGKIELFSEQAAEKWNVSCLPDFEKINHPEDFIQRYPLNLMSPNTKNRIHSQFGNLEMIRELDPSPFASVNEHDAAARNLKTGDPVRIFNDKGEIRIKLKTDPGLRPGNVVVFNGYWHSEGACPNILSAGKETDMGHGTAFHDTRVEIELDLS